MSDASGNSGASLLARILGFIFSLSRTAFLGLISLFSIGGLIAAALGAAAYVVGAWVVAGITAAIISLGSSFIQWAGSIFNFFIEHLITKFSTTLSNFGIMAGIDTVWTVFRDVANIGLIGLFVFLAINIILGVKSFGEKKMIARVLIVAVLLNFSLLFTKIIIDAGNFTAYQFYRAAGLPEGSAATAGGVADVFLHAMGITGIADTYNGVKAMADAKGTGTALGFSAIAILLLLLMLVLFLYGAFQIIARSILLVFLMVISPLAFASWLVPSNVVGSKWSEWWQALLSSAFFAPLFMMMLWASMTLLQQVAQKRGNTTLGQFFTTSAATPDAWAVIFLYCFAAGLLYASIRFASALSHSIAGYASVSQGLRNALVGIPGLGWKFGIAPLARQTIGWAGYGFQQNRMGAAQKARDAAAEAETLRARAERRRDYSAADRYGATVKKQTAEAQKQLALSGRYGAVAGGRLNAMDTRLAKLVTGSLGVKGTLAGASEKDTKSLSDQMKTRAETAEKKATKLAPDNRKVESDFRAERREEEMARKSAEEIKKGVAEAIKGEMQAEKTHKESEQKREQRNLEDARLRGEESRIEEAVKKIRSIQDDIDNIDNKKFTTTYEGKRVTASHNEAQTEHKAAETHHENYKRETDNLVNELKVAVGKVGEETARGIGRREGTVLERSWGKVTGINAEVSKKAGDVYKKNRGGDAELKRLADLLKNESAPSKPPEDTTIKK